MTVSPTARYLSLRGDAKITTVEQLAANSSFYDSAAKPVYRERSHLLGLLKHRDTLAYDTAHRMQKRFAVQAIILDAMAEHSLDAFVYLTNLRPPELLAEPTPDHRRPPTPTSGFFSRQRDCQSVPPPLPLVGVSIGMWRGRQQNDQSRRRLGFFGQHGLPALTVPIGFTQSVWNCVADTDGSTHMEGPLAARLPIGMDIIGRPFAEPVLVQLAAALEASTQHREPPPAFA